MIRRIQDKTGRLDRRSFFLRDGIRLPQCPMRTWVIWLSLFLLAITIGWFWLLSHDLQLTRTDQTETKIATEPKTEAGK